MSVFFLSDSLIFDTIVQCELSISSSSQYIVALWTVFDLVDVAFVRLVGLLERVRWTIIEFYRHLIAS